MIKFREKTKSHAKFSTDNRCGEFTFFSFRNSEMAISLKKKLESDIFFVIFFSLKKIITTTGREHFTEKKYHLRNEKYQSGDYP